MENFIFCGVTIIVTQTEKSHFLAVFHFCCKEYVLLK